MSLLSKFFNRQWKAVGLAIGLIGILALAACSSASAAPIKATWVKPQVSGETLSIAAGDVAAKKIVHFTAKTALGDENFMAYVLNGRTYVRANVCPPCRSVGFSLSGERLICDTCKTVFNAKTGEGISGACVAYPKAEVAFQTSGASLTMQSRDLQVAFQNTLQPGQP